MASDAAFVGRAVHALSQRTDDGLAALTAEPREVRREHVRVLGGLLCGEGMEEDTMIMKKDEEERKGLHRVTHTLTYLAPPV